jgi:hypothetical protein
MQLFLIAIGCLILTILFDYIYFKIEEKRDVNANFELFNKQREREGKPRINTFEDLKKEREEKDNEENNNTR